MGRKAPPLLAFLLPRPHLSAKVCSAAARRELRASFFYFWHSKKTERTYIHLRFVLFFFSFCPHLYGWVVPLHLKYVFVPRAVKQKGRITTKKRLIPFTQSFPPFATVTEKHGKTRHRKNNHDIADGSRKAREVVR